MRLDDTDHVTTAEWRWAVTMGSIFVLLAAMPFLWIVLIGVPGSGWEFMGVLHNHQDGAVELSRMLQNGDLLTTYLHTPEPHDATLNGLLYPLLGQISRLTPLSPVIVFHIVRSGAALVMYMALYQLAASIWTKQRPRRVFFLLLSMGSGFGWILAPITGYKGFIDITTPSAFPFYASLVNVHYPITIASIALLTSVIVIIFRPGVMARPTINNEGLSVFLVSLLLSFVYPLALIPLSVAFAITLGVDWYKTKVLSRMNLHWALWFGVPALPMAAYYIAVARYNPVVAEIWRQQKVAPVWPLLLLLGLGLPLLIALPGIYRAIRRFEADGDRFMLIWLFTIVAFIYLPTFFHQRFAIALMIPIVYFATRATEDFWLKKVTSRHWHRRIFAAAVPIIAASNFFVLMLPLTPLSRDDFSEAGNILLQNEYIEAFNWLKQHTNAGDVILASPDVSLWIPTRIGARSLYGHPRQTTDPDIKKAAVIAWYQQDAEELCQPLLNGAVRFDKRYTVKYVIVGPQEEAIGQTVCLDALFLVQIFDTVKVYAVRPPTGVGE